jgi:hypothetical protein
MTACAMHTYALKCGEVSIWSALGWSNPAIIPRAPDSMATKTWAARYGVAGCGCHIPTIMSPVLASKNIHSVHGTGGIVLTGLELAQVLDQLYPYTS